ncbi:MAG TPA: beta-ketoacyl-[acyl-carrier-protein] synthase family protein [Polyangiaceae bacterium]|jgi:3-oxoacyl-[acyl-carrier-protein] synthase II
MRIWITGVGIVSALDSTARGTFARLCAGERGLGPIDLFDVTGQRASLGAQVRGVDVPKDPLWSRTTAFAHLAAKEALEIAGVDPRGARVGLVVGGTTAGMFENEVRVTGMMSGRLPLTPAEELRSHPLSSTADALDAAIGPFVRMRNVASACSSGVTALAVARAWLLEDEIDVVVAGGTDGLCRLTLSGFNALSAIDPEPCRPFDVSRRGLNLGEGAGFLVLERAERAKKRGRTPIAELAGIALAAEAHHITNPESEGRTAARVMREALEHGGIGPRDVDYVNAHGTATPLNDAMESKAIHAVFGAETDRVWVSSSKGQIGHTLAAAGAIETAIAAMCVSERVLPPTAGLRDVDPACALRHVREAVRLPRVRAVVSSSFGFGGMDAAAVVTEPELGPEPRASRRRVVALSAAAIGPRGAGDASDLTSGAQASGAAPDSFGLDATKARRFDRAARLCAAAANRNLQNATIDRARAGVVFGSAFSSVDEAAAFVQRIFDKGPRLASPADFPNLVPSSPVGHASIYEGLLGPALATADLRSSGESAIATAMDLIASGDADAFVAGAVAVRSKLIDEVFHPLFDDGATRAPRAECCAAVLVAAEGTPGAIARVEAIIRREGEPLVLTPPAEGARVYGAVSAEATARWLEATSWRGVPIESVELGVGDNEAAGAAAFGAAVRAIERGVATEALVIGVRASQTGNITHAFVLRRP